MEDYNETFTNKTFLLETTKQSLPPMILECTEQMLGPQRGPLYIVVPIIVIYVIIFLTGTIGNFSTCIVISKNKSMHTATNYYLFSLAISDLLLLVSGLPQEIYLIWSRYPYVFGSAFCFLHGLFAETSANATVLTITAFTVERYLAICHPFLSHTMSKLSRAIKFILCIWLGAVLLAIPQAMQFHLLEGKDDCKMCHFKGPIVEHSFEMSTFFFFIAPMTLITVLYVLIGMRLKSSNMISKRSFNNGTPSRSSKKIVKMLVAVVVAFFLCWAPFHAQRLYTLYYSKQSASDRNTHPMYLKIYEVVTYVSGILYYVSATINPILYNIMSVKFRDAFKETFARCCGLPCLKSHRPQRCYSVLSRSGNRCPDSTESGKDEPTYQTHSSLSHKDSIDSVSCNPILQNHQDCKRMNKSSSYYMDQHDGMETPAGNGVLKSRQFAFPELMTVQELETPTRMISVHIATPPPAPKQNAFLQIFHCFPSNKQEKTKRNFYVMGGAEPATPNILVELDKKQLSDKLESRRGTINGCDISNSSLRDIEAGALEDELTAYMKEIQQREYYRR